MNPRAPDLSIVIPCYRSEASLDRLVAELDGICSANGWEHEIVLVNDASPDDTWDKIDEISRAKKHVIGIDLLSNHGQPMATMCGLSMARGVLVATMDDDLEHRPDQLPLLIRRLETDSGIDAVVATWPIERGGLRDIGSKIHSFADRIAWGTPKDFRHTAYRVMRRPVRDALVAYQTRSPVVGPMMNRLAHRVENVTVDNGQRAHGRSGFSTREGVRRVIVNFSSGSTAPLKLMTVAGFGLALLGFLLGALLLARWSLGADSPSGWLSVILTLLVIGGANLCAIGVLGGYAEVIVREVRRAPRWSVRDVTNTDIDSAGEGRDV